MRCYFMQQGDIAEVGVLADSSDEDAVKQSVALFCRRPLRYTGFEVWDDVRFVYRHRDEDSGDANIPWLKIEHAADGYQVHWHVERQCGPNTVVDLGHSQSFATKSEAQRWRAVFVSALPEEEPLLPR